MKPPEVSNSKQPSPSLGRRWKGRERVSLEGSNLRSWNLKWVCLVEAGITVGLGSARNTVQNREERPWLLLAICLSICCLCLPLNKPNENFIVDIDCLPAMIAMGPLPSDPVLSPVFLCSESQGLTEPGKYIQPAGASLMFSTEKGRAEDWMRWQRGSGSS